MSNPYTPLIQVKWAHVTDGFVAFKTSTVERGTSRRYAPGAFDFFVAYAGVLGTLYVLPFETVGSCAAVQLRLDPARNGQRAKIRWAADWQFNGALPWPDPAAALFPDEESPLSGSNR